MHIALVATMAANRVIGKDGKLPWHLRAVLQHFKRVTRGKPVVMGRTTYESSQEIRNHHLTREEGVALVHRFEGEFPSKYFKEVLEYIDMTEEAFFKLSDRVRPPHLWERVGSDWKLLHRVE